MPFLYSVGEWLLFRRTMSRSLFCLLVFALPLFGLSNSYALSAGDGYRDFKLPDLSGKEVRLSDIKDRVILLHFWALWCGSCKDEMPSLNNLYNALRERGLEVITISTDTSTSRLKEFVLQHKINLPILLDTDKKVTVSMYGVIGIPVTFIIDKRGKVIEKIQGVRDWNSAKMRNKLERLLRSNSKDGKGE